jgi:hypothetical protein
LITEILEAMTLVVVVTTLLLLVVLKAPGVAAVVAAVTALLLLLPTLTLGLLLLLPHGRFLLCRPILLTRFSFLASTRIWQCRVGLEMSPLFRHRVAVLDFDT